MEPLLVTSQLDSSICVWEAKNGEYALLSKLEEHGASVHGLCVEGPVLLSASFDRCAKMWDLRAGRCMRSFVGHSQGVRTVAIKSGRVVTGGADKALRVWDKASGACVQVFKGSLFKKGHSGEINKVLFDAHDPDLFYSASGDKTVRCWSLATNRCIATMRGHASAVTSLAICDPHLVSGSKDHSCIVWHLTRRKEISVLTGHTGAVWAVAVQDNVVASGSDDRSVKVWDISSPRSPVCTGTLQGHSNLVYAVVLHNNRVISGSWDESIRVWDWRSCVCLRSLATGSWVYDVLVITREENMGRRPSELPKLADLDIDEDDDGNSNGNGNRGAGRRKDEGAAEGGDEGEGEGKAQARGEGEVRNEQDEEERLFREAVRKLSATEGIAAQNRNRPDHHQSLTNLPSVEGNHAFPALHSAPSSPLLVRHAESEKNDALSSLNSSFSEQQDPKGAEAPQKRRHGKHHHRSSSRHTHSSSGELPEHFVCPITQEIMQDPVVASDGHTYERTAIEQWLKKHSRSPMTNERLDSKNLVSNHLVKSQISEFQQQRSGKTSRRGRKRGESLPV